MVEDPYVLDSPKTPSEFEIMVRNDFSRLLAERKYSSEDTSALLVAFDTAAEIHRRKDERRKVPKPFWGGAAGGEPYIGHIGRILHFMLIEPAFDYRLDYKLLSAVCLHDTLETLTEKEPDQFHTRELALDFVMGKFFTNLDNAGLTDYLLPSTDTKKIVYSLSRDHNDVYYKSIGQLFSLEPDNLMRALTIKGFDRMDNSIDLQDLSLYGKHWELGCRQWPGIFTDLKKTLKSYFKTLFVANETKRYVVTQNPQDSPLSSNLRQMPRIVAMNMKLVYDIISGTLKEYAESLPDGKGSRLLGEIEHAKQEMEEYDRNGGFEKVTCEGELHSIYDGTISKYDRILRFENIRHTYAPSPLEIYRDARSNQTLLHLLSRADKPNYYLHGFEWETFYKQQ
jgi:hypothetical protein